MDEGISGCATGQHDSGQTKRDGQLGDMSAAQVKTLKTHQTGKGAGGQDADGGLLRTLGSRPGAPFFDQTPAVVKIGDGQCQFRRTLGLGLHAPFQKPANLASRVAPVRSQDQFHDIGNALGLAGSEHQSDTPGRQTGRHRGFSVMRHRTEIKPCRPAIGHRSQSGEKSSKAFRMMAIIMAHGRKPGA